ncbi:DUF6875 domain-containing protein [Streptomyces sp. NPDC003691]
MAPGPVAAGAQTEAGAHGAPAGPDGGTAARSAVLQWLVDFVGQPHRDLGRDGAVCPFVEPALRADALVLEERTGYTDPTPGALRDLLRRMAASFTALPRAGALRALVVVLPDFPESRGHLLDSLQAEAKPRLAEEGLMLGQFHPRCDDRAVRNPRLPVSRAPVPLLALRDMALHDILFLDSDARCFHAYRRRFADRYGDPGDEAGARTLFRRRYARAGLRFGAAALPSGGPR